MELGKDLLDPTHQPWLHWKMSLLDLKSALKNKYTHMLDSKDNIFGKSNSCIETNKVKEKERGGPFEFLEEQLRLSERER